MNTQQEKARNNIFGCILTNEAPSSNYRGGVEGNLNVLQKLRYEDGEHTIFSAESIRNRLRDMLKEDGFLSNRSRLSSQGQLAVKYESYPNPLKYIDDLLFGFLALSKSKDLEELQKKINSKPKKKKTKSSESSEEDATQELSNEEIERFQAKLDQMLQFPEFQGDSVLRVNYAVSLKPFKHDQTLHQSPQIYGWKDKPDNSAIIQREVHVSPYQYPFGLNLNDLLVPQHICEDLNLDEQQRQEYEKNAKLWTAALLKAIGELNGVGGNHARTMFPFSPISIVLRLTSRRTPDFDIYGFRNNHTELLDDLMHDRLPRNEFYLGGNIVKKMDENLRASLMQGDKPIKLFEMSKDAIDALVSDAGLEV